MNKTFEQVMQSIIFYWWNTIGQLDQLEWKTLLPYPKPFAIL